MREFNVIHGDDCRLNGIKICKFQNVHRCFFDFGAASVINIESIRSLAIVSPQNHLNHFTQHQVLGFAWAMYYQLRMFFSCIPLAVESCIICIIRMHMSLVNL